MNLKEYPPSQASDMLSIHKALETAMAKLESVKTSNN
jgi:arylsulfatase